MPFVSRDPRDLCAPRVDQLQRASLTPFEPSLGIGRRRCGRCIICFSLRGSFVYVMSNGKDPHFGV